MHWTSIVADRTRCVARETDDVGERCLTNQILGPGIRLRDNLGEVALILSAKNNRTYPSLLQFTRQIDVPISRPTLSGRCGAPPGAMTI